VQDIDYFERKLKISREASSHWDGYKNAVEELEDQIKRQHDACDNVIQAAAKLEREVPPANAADAVSRAKQCNLASNKLMALLRHESIQMQEMEAKVRAIEKEAEVDAKIRIEALIRKKALEKDNVVREMNDILSKKTRNIDEFRNSGKGPSS
jgi:hypothetical protein